MEKGPIPLDTPTWIHTSGHKAGQRGRGGEEEKRDYCTITAHYKGQAGQELALESSEVSARELGFPKKNKSRLVLSPSHNLGSFISP